MLAEKDHLLQFEHNVAVAQRLVDSADYDWAVTALFYACLHLAQAYLVRVGVLAETHVQRERQMLRLPELSPILSTYRTLRDHSEDARYSGRRFTQAEFVSIHDGTFTAVVTRLRSLLEGQQ